jgi:tRNA pseudouridine55 synthase
MSSTNHINGFLNINKHKNVTSNGILNILKRLYKVEKCGHLGTLDPMATGVLPVAINKATKIISILQEGDKEYLVTALLGIHTDSFDVTGNVIYKSNLVPNKEDILKAIDKYIGEIELEIPIYSAVKINGVRAYKLAREKKISYCGKRKAYIYDINLVDYDYPELKLLVKCGKGTYIRSLIKHLGEDLQSYAVVSELIRLRYGKFLIEDAYTINEQNSELTDLKNLIKPIEEIIDLPKAILKDGAIDKIKKGQSPNVLDYLHIPSNAEKICAIFNTKKELLCIAKKDIKNKHIPYTVDKVLIN